MAIVSKDKERLAVALELAEASLWSSIMDTYPEATSGDLSPACAIALSTAMEKAVIEWLEFNVDVSPVKTTNILLHNIEYQYRDYDNLTLTSSDEEHIAYSISQGISEGDLCTIPEDETSEVYGYWKINNG